MNCFILDISTFQNQDSDQENIIITAINDKNEKIIIKVIDQLYQFFADQYLIETNNLIVILNDKLLIKQNEISELNKKDSFNANEFKSEIDNAFGVKQEHEHENNQLELEKLIIKNQKKYFVKDISVVEKENIQQQKVENKIKKYFKIFLNNPECLYKLKSLLRTGIEINESTQTPHIYESTFDLIQKFTVDNGIQGNSWININKLDYDVDNGLQFCSFKDLKTKNSNNITNIDLKIMYINLIYVPINQEIAQCNNESKKQIQDKQMKIKGVGDYEIEKIINNSIQIISLVFTNIKNTSKEQITLTIGKYNYQNDISCSDEQSLLNKFKDIFLNYNPDIIVGQKLEFLILPIIIERLKIQNINYNFLSRSEYMKPQQSFRKHISKSTGDLLYGDCKIFGRIPLCLHKYFRKDDCYNFKSYSLSQIVQSIIDKSVHTYSFNEIQTLVDQNKLEIVEYSRKICDLIIETVEKSNILLNYLEDSFIFRMVVNKLINRGNMVKLLIRVSSKCKELGQIICDNVKKVNSVKHNFQGGCIIEPKVGFQDVPVAVFDFASLYPSIVVAQNICCSTLIPLNSELTESQSGWDGPKIHKADLHTSPDNVSFIKRKKKIGVFPAIVEDLIASRNKVKEEILKCTDEFMKQSLKSRESAIKKLTNAIQGATGSTVGILPCLEMSISITSFGRWILMRSTEVIKTYFANHYRGKHAADVLFGHTDSLMIRFFRADLNDTFKFAQEVLTAITKEFKAPIKLKFENVQYPLLVIKKCNYTGMTQSSPNKPPVLEIKGGLFNNKYFTNSVNSLLFSTVKILLEDRDIEKAFSLFKFVFRQTMNQKIDIGSMQFTKLLAKSEQLEVQSPHVYLYEKLKNRNPRYAPVCGELVDQTIIKRTQRDVIVFQDIYERAEDPLFCLENDLIIDVEQLLEIQYSELFNNIFEWFIDGQRIENVLRGNDTQRILKKTNDNVNPNQDFDLVKQNVEKKCLVCKRECNQNVCCISCINGLEQKLQRIEWKQRDKLNEFSMLNSHCYQCKLSCQNKINCFNTDCPIFWRKYKNKELLNKYKLQVKHIHSYIPIIDW